MVKGGGTRKQGLLTVEKSFRSGNNGNRVFIFSVIVITGKFFFEIMVNTGNYHKKIFLK